MRNSKEKLIQDFHKIVDKSMAEAYMMEMADAFALGYLASKYDLERFIDNQEVVIKACQKYDEDDDLCIHDTIGETLIDLGIINNDEGEL